jgi:hypothetical protein
VQFSTFFSPAWLDAFRVSLRNLLSVVFSSVPLPKLFVVHAYEEEQAKSRAQIDKARWVGVTDERGGTVGGGGADDGVMMGFDCGGESSGWGREQGAG